MALSKRGGVAIRRQENGEEDVGFHLRSTMKAYNRWLIDEMDRELDYDRFGHVHTDEDFFDDTVQDQDYYYEPDQRHKEPEYNRPRMSQVLGIGNNKKKQQ